MASKLITAPSVEPILLADVKAQIGIKTADTASDAVITRRIVEARQWAEDFTRRAFITQTWELAADRFPTSEIALPMCPVSSVSSVTYVDTAGSTQTLDPLTYSLDDYGDQHWLLLASGESWPATQDSANSVKVRYVAGYGSTGASVPGPINEALMLLVGHWMNFQTGIEGATTITRIPYAVQDLLGTYRIPRIG